MIHSTARSHGVLHPLRVGMVDPTERQRADRRVIDVGVVDVVVLERPPARSQARAPHRPVARHVEYLSVEQPVGGAHQRRVVAVQAGVGQRQHRERGVPHRRLAGLQPHGLAILDGEPIEPGQARPDHRVIQRIALEMQRHQRVHPRRLDAAPAAVRLLALEHPSLGRGQGRAPQRPNRMPLVDAQQAVEDGEHPSR